MGAGSSAALPFSASTIDIYSSLPEKLTKEQCIEVVGKRSTDQLWSKFMNVTCDTENDYDHCDGSSSDKCRSGGKNGGGCRSSSECISRERLLSLSAIGALNQKKERNFKHTLPKIYFLDYKYFKTAGSFPRFNPANAALLTTDQFNHSKVFIIFISHAWLCSGSGSTQRCGAAQLDQSADYDDRYDEGGESGGEFPYPDTVENTKWQLCVDGIERLRHNHTKGGMDECFVWVDYSCLDQDLNPVLEIEELDEIMACCDCLITPIIAEEEEEDQDHPEEDQQQQEEEAILHSSQTAAPRRRRKGRRKGRRKERVDHPHLSADKPASASQSSPSSPSSAAASSLQWDHLVPERSSGVTSLAAYQAEAWTTHLSRAWTRLEMVGDLDSLASAVPCMYVYVCVCV